MLKKNLIIVFVFGLLFVFASSLNAQETTTENKENKMMMQDGDMQNCMNKIAADSTMRMQMMNKMMNNTKGDKEGMMQMCKTMMDNPEMHKMMMNMMDSEGMMMGGKMMNQKSCCMGNKDSNMMKDSTQSMDKSEHESHH